MPAGEENFIAQTYDFVVADMPLTQAQLKTCNRCVSTPVQAIALLHVKLQHAFLECHRGRAEDDGGSVLHL